MLSLSMLSGCAGLGKHRLADDPWVKNAEARLGTGDYEGAAEIFEERAVPSGHPDYFRLRAADAHLRAGDSAAAQALVSTVDPGQLDAADRVDYYLLAARVNLNVGRAAQANGYLDKVAASPRDRSQDLHYHLLRASAYNQLGLMLDSARERVQLAPFLTGTDAIDKNNAAIFDALNRLPDRVLDYPSAAAPDVLSGWMALTRILRSETTADLSGQLQQWRARYPNHPADGPFLEQALRESGRQVEIGRIAKPEPAPTEAPRDTGALTTGARFAGVMVPLSGSYASAGEAIRAGMLAAFYSDDAPDKLALRFVDSQSSDVGQLYKEFAAQGAVLAVGPLLKEGVAKALQMPDLPIPMLALNQVPGAAAGTVVQFGLTPEQEVEQAAGAAWFDGHRKAVLLAPSSPFGQRLANHFAAYWKGLGGRVVATKTYVPNGADYSEPVRAVAAVAGANAEVPATPQMMQKTVDFVFLIANAHDGRLIKPQFDINQLSSFPIYATSHVFTGRPDPRQDRDLDGIYFCDIPWLLHAADSGPLSAASLNAEIEKTAPDFVKLIALGIDAYRLAKDMAPIGNFRGHLFDGATGILTLQSDNRVQRQLECAQFEGGIPQLRGLAPVLHPAEQPGRP